MRPGVGRAQGRGQRLDVQQVPAGQRRGQRRARHRRARRRPLAPARQGQGLVGELAVDADHLPLGRGQRTQGGESLRGVARHHHHAGRVGQQRHARIAAPGARQAIELHLHHDHAVRVRRRADPARQEQAGPPLVVPIAKYSAAPSRLAGGNRAGNRSAGRRSCPAGRHWRRRRPGRCGRSGR